MFNIAVLIVVVGYFAVPRLYDKIYNHLEQSVEHSYGNTTGNNINGGLAAKQGDWVYYGNTSGLYKTRTDGTEVIKLIGEASSNINVVDDWVYYVNVDGRKRTLSKIRTDGTELTRFDITNVGPEVSVVDDWIYYNAYDENNFVNLFYKVRTDGTRVTRLSRGSCESINVVDGWIYYINAFPVRKVRTNGTGKKEILVCQRVTTES